MEDAKSRIDALLLNSATFADKGRQVVPDTITAFGIHLSSRHGKVYEVIDMLGFATEAAKGALAHYVRAVNYDSNACVCSFELDKSVVKGSEIELELFRVAKSTIPHFYWFDEEYIHGKEDPL